MQDDYKGPTIIQNRERLYLVIQPTRQESGPPIALIYNDVKTLPKGTRALQVHVLESEDVVVNEQELYEYVRRLNQALDVLKENLRDLANEMKRTAPGGEQ